MREERGEYQIESFVIVLLYRFEIREEVRERYVLLRYKVGVQVIIYSSVNIYCSPLSICSNGSLCDPDQSIHLSRC